MRALLPFPACCLVALTAVGASVAQDPPSLRLSVFVVGSKDAPETKGMLDAVRGAGMAPRLVERAACAPEALRTADVVLVDWPAEDALGERLPLGPFERWDRPTVFVGTAGERFANRWGLPTATAMAAMPGPTRGPEMQERRPPDGAVTVVWRQGHLFHFPAPSAALRDGSERAWLMATLTQAARFVSDRPILRLGAPAGAELPVAERERRERVAAACLKLGLEAHDRASLMALPERLVGGDQATAARLLVDLLPGSKDASATRNTWSSWLGVHGAALVWDPLSFAWRLDRLAFGRGVASSACRDDARADGADRPADAVALAGKVVLHHGGRALADLATFSCWLGDVHYQWDRRGGWFRMENHADVPAGARATAWTVSVLDTAADEEVIWGGGPPPRPRVSARGDFRDLVERVFLPTLLLDPGTSLRRRAEDDADGLQALGVHLAGRCMDPTVEHVLLVEPATGAVVRTWRLVRGRASYTTSIAATTACGPLLLPTGQVDGMRNRPREFTIVDAKWNPELPPALATATERLAKPRGR